MIFFVSLFFLGEGGGQPSMIQYVASDQQGIVCNIYIYIYMCMRVCVCGMDACMSENEARASRACPALLVHVCTRLSQSFHCRGLAASYRVAFSKCLLRFVFS